MNAQPASGKPSTRRARNIQPFNAEFSEKILHIFQRAWRVCLTNAAALSE
jgi:hypothetical protein